MSQEVIKVTLSQQAESDVLTFDIKEKTSDPEYIVDLSDATKSQAQLKRVFSRLLTLLVDNGITLELVIDEGFARALQKEVCEEYIKSLNTELLSVKEVMTEQLGTNLED
jgi:hypothetical protein